MSDGTQQAGVHGSRTHRGLSRNPPTILKTAGPTGTQPPPLSKKIARPVSSVKLY